MGIVNRDGALYSATGIDNTGLYSGRREALGIIKSMAGEITSFDIFGGIGVSAAAAFAKAAKDAYTFEKDFQKSMYEVASISGTIKGSLTDYMNGIMDMTRQIPVAVNESAKALYQIVSAGHDGADAMNILEVSAKAAIGGVTDTATAADAITTVLNSYKMSASEAGIVSDQLFMTAKLGKTTMGELGQSIAQVAPIAASYGVEIDQVLAAVASLTKQGTPTAQAMTQIRASILGVSKVLGDGAFDSRTFQEALTEVAERAGGSESQLRTLIPEIEAVNGVLGLTGNNAKAAASDLNDLGDSLGASEDAFKTMQESADNQLQLLQNNIIATLRPLGEGILKEVSEAAQKMNDAFSNGDMENSLQTLETLIKLVSVAFVGYKIATLDALKTDNAKATATKLLASIKASYHKVIGDGILQQETERLSQEAYVASLEGSITTEQRALLEKQNLKKGSKEYADALSDIAVNAKNSADQEVESLTKSLAKNREKLSSAKERVEISKAATEAAKEELDTVLQSNDISATEAAQSKVISAAKREESATNDLNTVSRKINNQEKRLGIAQTKADSASTVLNSATTAGNAAATTVSSRAHNFLAAAKLKASIATRTLTAAMAANPIGAILTVVSLAASAIMMFGKEMGDTTTVQERFNKSLEEQKRQLDELKSKTEEYLEIIRSETSTQYDKEKALDSLQKMMPTIFKNMDIEKLKLMDILSLNKQIAEEINRRERIGAQTNLIMATNKYNTAAAEHKRKTDMGLVATNALSDKNDAFLEMELAQKQYDNILNIQKKAEESLKPKELKIVSLQSNIDTLKAEIAEMQLLVDKEKEETGGWSPTSAILDAKKGQLSSKEKKMAKLSPNKTGKAETKAKIQNEAYWTKQKNDAETELKALSDIEASGRKGAELKKKITEYQGKIDVFSPNTSKQEKQSDKLREEQEKYNLLLDRQKLDRQRQTEDLESQLTQSKVDAMTDGFGKQQAQRDLNNKKEIQALERQKDDYIRAIIQAEKDKFDAQEDVKAKQKKGYVKQTFDSSTVKVDSSAFNGIINNTSKKQLNDKVREQEDSWNEYLIKFGDYQQKRKAIIEKYDKLIKEAEDAGKAATHEKDKQNAVDDLDNSIKNSSTLMGQLFADASQKSVSEIQKVIEKAELLMQYLESVKDEKGNAQIGGKTVSKKDILGLGVSDNTLQNLGVSTEEVEALRNAISKLKGELGGKSPFILFESQIDAAIGKISQGGNKNIAQGITEIGGAIASFSPAISQFGQDLGNIFGSDDLGNKIAGVSDALGGVGQTAAGVGQIMSGDIVGGVMSAVSGISSVVSALDGLFGADYSEYDAMVAKYDVLLDVWDELLDKKKAYIKESYGAEATKAGEEALKLLNSEKRITKELASSRLDSGASAGSHSINYRMWKGSYDYNGQNWKDVAPEISNALGGVDFSSMWSMLEMSSEQLELIKTNYSELWAHMDGDFKGYLDNIIQYGETEKEIIASVKEQITGISLDSFQDSYVNMLSDMDSTNEDFADNFEEYLKKSILQSLIAKNYTSKIQSLYDSWATAGDDDVYTDDEINELRDKQQKITDEMLAEREELMKTMGWDSSSGSSQDSTQKGFAAMSQDTGNELNGRFTALQESNEGIKISNEEIKNQLIFQSGIQGDMLRRLDEIYKFNAETSSERSDMMLSVIDYLESICQNTNSLPRMEKILEDIKRSSAALAGK